MFSRKDYPYLVVMFCLFTASFSFHLWAEEISTPPQDQPHISFDSPRYDAGEVWEGDKVSHTFTVRNTGNARLDIKSIKPG